MTILLQAYILSYQYISIFAFYTIVLHDITITIVAIICFVFQRLQKDHIYAYIFT